MDAPQPVQPPLPAIRGRGVPDQQVRVGGNVTKADGAVVGNQRVRRDVRGEQRHRPEPARIGQVGKRRGERQSGPDPHRGVQR